MTTKLIEVVVLVDADGDYAVGHDADSARADYESNVQSLDSTDGFRLFNLKLTVPLPEPVELAGEVKAEPETTTLSVTAAK